MKITKSKEHSGFTLVELIVVIAILAILATISFLSFSSQSASARDSTRLFDMNNIVTGLGIFNATTGKLPMPDSKVDIQASGSTIGYQGYAGASVLNMIKISNGGKDPLDTTSYYTYSTNLAQSKLQVLGFLEDGSNTALGFNPFGGNTANADTSSYTGRYVITKGDQIGILLNGTTWTPAQTANTAIDVITSTGTYIAQFTNKEKVAGTGAAIYVLNSTMKIGGTKFPGCDQYNIVIGSQTWAGCNSTQGTGIEWGYKDDGSEGTVASCYSYNAINTVGNCPIGDSSMASNSKEKTWSEASGISGTVDNVWGKLYTWAQASQANNACPTGWHLPSDQEWTMLELSLTPSCTDTALENIWRCVATGLGWAGNASKSVSSNMVQALKIPLGGVRDTDGSTFSHRGDRAYLWSSSASGSTAYRRYLNRSSAGVYRNLHDKAYGFSVRCVKDQ